jgi:hypothetical protein
MKLEYLHPWSYRQSYATEEVEPESSHAWNYSTIDKWPWYYRWPGQPGSWHFGLRAYSGASCSRREAIFPSFPAITTINESSKRYIERFVRPDSPLAGARHAWWYPGSASSLCIAS